MKTDLSLLMKFLVPNKTSAILNDLKIIIGNDLVDWDALLFQANFHLCTPLWYLQLNKNELLEYLPEELSEYLFHLYHMNLDRNNFFQDELAKILQTFNEHSIDSILLKGAATFCDNLFEPGTRVMGDLDILVPVEKVALCQELISSLGYVPYQDVDVQELKMPADKREHHLVRHVKPGTPVVVEIHFRLSNGRAGYIFDIEDVWKNCVRAKFRGKRTSILSPNHRILLNTVHALLPHREYLLGNISVLQWVEFSLLAHKYSQSINWEQWFLTAEKNNLSNEFEIYYYFSTKYLQSPKDIAISFSGRYLKFNVNRLLFISQYQDQNIKKSVLERFRLSIYKSGYYFHLIRWLWDNKCYEENMTGVIKRIFFCIKKLFSKNSRRHYWYG